MRVDLVWRKKATYRGISMFSLLFPLFPTAARSFPPGQVALDRQNEESDALWSPGGHEGGRGFTLRSQSPPESH